MPQYARITLRPGVVLNHRTAAMLSEVERRLGVHIPVIKGSYTGKPDPRSADTHVGGGALDVPAGVMGATAGQIVLAARRVGFAAWHRTPDQGPWSEHIHMIAVGDQELSTGAANQVKAYVAGYNGLGHLGRGGRDHGPTVAPWHRWPLMRRIAAVRLANATVKAAERDLAQWRRDHS